MTEYIEREKLTADFELCNKQNPRWTPQRVASLIARANAADVVEVVHGRWVQVICHVEFEDGFVDRLYECCSRCHKPNGRKMTGYCPNCGADMLVGEEEKLESRSKAYVTDKNVGNIIPVNDLYDEDGADVQNT